MTRRKLELTPRNKPNSKPIALSTKEDVEIEKIWQTIMEERARHQESIKGTIADDDLAFRPLTTVD